MAYQIQGDFTPKAGSVVPSIATLNGYNSAPVKPYVINSATWYEYTSDGSLSTTGDFANGLYLGSSDTTTKTFRAGMQYTVKILIGPASGYTFEGLPEDFFYACGIKGTNPSSNFGEVYVTIEFPKLPDGSVTNVPINALNIQGVAVPVRGVAPTTTLTATDQYTATISWSPTVSGTFAADTAYTATITLTAKTPTYTLTGVQANSFKVAGADTVTNAANSGVITAVFPKTGPAPTYTLSLVNCNRN